MTDVLSRENRKKPQVPGLPISTVNGGFGTNITQTVFSPAAMFDNQPYAFYSPSARQYFTLLEKGPTLVPAMDISATNARVIRVPPGHRYIQLVDGSISAEVAFDEDFKFQVLGFVYNWNGSTLLHDMALQPFDTPIEISFAAGDRASKQLTGQFSLAIGGQLATHIGLAVQPMGSTIYQGLVSGTVAYKP